MNATSRLRFSFGFSVSVGTCVTVVSGSMRLNSMTGGLVKIGLGDYVRGLDLKSWLVCVMRLYDWSMPYNALAQELLATRRIFCMLRW
jgi:hypothetical protein